MADNNGATSDPVLVTLSPAAPAIFTLDQSGRGQAAVLIGGTGQVAGALGRPARRGEVLEIFLTGLGQLDNPPQPGAAGPTQPLARTLLNPVVTIGGVPAQVLFSGLAPGLAGVYQVNARIAEGTPSGAAVELVVLTGPARSQSGVTLAVE